MSDPRIFWMVWCPTGDSDGVGGGNVGIGSTEQEAINDLLEQEDDAQSEQPTQVSDAASSLIPQSYYQPEV